MAESKMKYWTIIFLLCFSGYLHAINSVQPPIKIAALVKYDIPIYHTISHLYYRATDSRLYHTINDFSAQPIGVLEQSLSASYLAQHYPNLLIKKFKDIHQLVLALDKKQIDGFIHEGISAWHKLVNELKFSEIIKLDDFEIANSIYGAISYSGRVTQDLLTLGVSKISKAKLIELEKRCIVNPQLRSLSLENESLTPPQYLLTESDRQ